MKSELERQQRRVAWIFIGPALGLIAAFFVLPVVSGLLLSLTDFDIYAVGSPGRARFVGLRNYAQVLTSPDFLRALKNTMYFVIAGAPLAVLASLGAALLLSARLVRLRSFFRTVYCAPVVTTLVAVAIVWRYLYHPKYGLLIHALGWLGLGPVDWLGDPHWSMPAIILLAVWKNFGYNMLIFVAGLQSIPDELYEAAAVDGADARQRFWHVTLPGLAPSFLFVSVTTMIGYFQVFAEPYVLTGGALLNLTYSLVLFMYTEGFRWWNMGFAAAVAFALFLVILLATLVQAAVQRRRRA